MERVEDDGTKIYGIYKNGVRFAEVEMKTDGTGTITMNDPDNIREPKVVAYVTKADLDEHSAYHVEVVEGNDYVVINGRPFELDGEFKHKLEGMDKAELKQKVNKVKQAVKAKRMAG